MHSVLYLLIKRVNTVIGMAQCILSKPILQRVVNSFVLFANKVSDKLALQRGDTVFRIEHFLCRRDRYPIAANH